VWQVKSTLYRKKRYRQNALWGGGPNLKFQKREPCPKKREGRLSGATGSKIGKGEKSRKEDNRNAEGKTLQVSKGKRNHPGTVSPPIMDSFKGGGGNS